MKMAFDFYIVMEVVKTPAYVGESLDYWAYRDYGQAMEKFHGEKARCRGMFDVTDDGMVMDSSHFQEWRDEDGNGYVVYCAGETFNDSRKNHLNDGNKKHETDD